MSHVADDGSAGRSLGIGAFARRSRLSAKALRLYDRLGLLVPAEVDASNGYRSYRESQLAVARLLVSLRRLDMPLATVAEVLAADDRDRSGLVESYWTGVERRFATQLALKAHLITRLSGTEGSDDMYDIHERDVPEQLVLSELRHLTVNGLTEWLGSTIGRLHGTAADLGVSAGSTFVIFHGEVNEDSDGPVEVCVPISGTDGVDLSGHPQRVEPAHREAYTPITRAQTEFPQILSAYDAVHRWLAEHGKEATAAPREVYVDGFVELAPNDHGCDVAYPFAG